MSEQVKRDEQAINAEYASLCTQLGDIYTKKHGLEAQIKLIHDRISELGLEMKALQESKQAAAAEEAKPVVAE